MASILLSSSGNCIENGMYIGTAHSLIQVVRQDSQVNEVDVLRRIDVIVRHAQDNGPRKLGISSHLITESLRLLFDFYRACIHGQTRELESAIQTVISLPEVGAQLKAKSAECSGCSKEVRFQNVGRLRIAVFSNNAPYLRCRPGYIGEGFLSLRIDLSPPQLALIIVMERQWRRDLFYDYGARGPP